MGTLNFRIQTDFLGRVLSLLKSFQAEGLAARRLTTLKQGYLRFWEVTRKPVN